jgi:membrane protease YdiL (CAAX protease family)
VYENRPPMKESSPEDSYARNSSGNTYVSGYGFVSYDPLRREQRDLRRTARTAGSTMLLIFSLSIALGVPVRIAVKGLYLLLAQFISDPSLFVSLSSLSNELSELLIDAGSLLIPAILAAKLLGRAKKSVVEERSSSLLPLAFLPIALSIWVLTEAFGELLQSAGQQIGIVELMPNTQLPAGIGGMSVYLLRLIILPAFLEEFLFRGILLNRLRRHGDAFALTVSAMLYGLIHYNLTDCLSGFAMGLVFGYIMLRTGTFKSAVIAHMGTAAMPVIFRLLQQFLPGQYRLIETELFVLILLMGLLTFVWICRREPNAFILSSKATGLALRERCRIFFGSGWVLLAIVLWTLQAAQSLQWMG